MEFKDSNYVMLNNVSKTRSTTCQYAEIQFFICRNEHLKEYWFIFRV